MVGEEKFKLSHRLQTIGQQQPRNSEQLSLLRRQLCLECCLLKWDKKKKSVDDMNWLHSTVTLLALVLRSDLLVLFFLLETPSVVHMFIENCPQLICRWFLNSLICRLTFSLENVSDKIRWSLDLRWQRPDKPNGFYGLKVRRLSYNQWIEMHFQSLPGSAQASSLTQQNSTQQQKTTNKFNHYYHFVQVLPIKITINS